MAFQTMPYLFEQWGSTLAVVAGVCWFGLLFCWYYFSYGNTLDGIHERRVVGLKKRSLVGAMILVLGLPTIIFKEGVFDEYDYWVER
jgi:hypothetical protein